MLAAGQVGEGSWCWWVGNWFPRIALATRIKQKLAAGRGEASFHREQDGYLRERS